MGSCSAVTPKGYPGMSMILSCPPPPPPPPPPTKAGGFMDDASIRFVFYCVLASAWSWLAWSFPIPRFFSLLAPGPPFALPPVVSLVACFRDPSLAPEDAVARDPRRVSTRHWSWIPRPGGPPSLSPALVAHRGGDRIGPIGVSKPLRLDEYHRPEESFHPSLLF